MRRFLQLRVRLLVLDSLRRVGEHHHTDHALVFQPELVWLAHDVPAQACPAQSAILSLNDALDGAPDQRRADAAPHADPDPRLYFMASRGMAVCGLPCGLHCCDRTQIVDNDPMPAELEGICKRPLWLSSVDVLQQSVVAARYW